MLVLPASRTTIRDGVTAMIRYSFRLRKTRKPVSPASY